MPKNIKAHEILYGLNNPNAAANANKDEEVETDPILMQNAAVEGKESGEKLKNPLFEKMQNARFLMIRAPN